MVLDIPLYGTITKNLQSLFFDRKNKQGRSQIFKKLSERIDLIERTNMLPLQIYPEGGITNGDWLLKF
jgi:hypothetical protein